MRWYLQVLKNYVGFKGRARRQEFWMFMLFHFIFIWILMLVSMKMDTPIIYALYYLATVLPMIAVYIRRLHDIGKSGWYILWLLVPLAGLIYMIVLWATEGNRSDNQYGPDPKGA